jgi:EAL domain-containing protein (putative c-di-GMP-specific phosphodiesterase class I)
MYAAKDDGGSQVRFCEVPLERGAPAETAPPGDSIGTFDSAGPLDPGYVLCYQPILAVKTGRVAAAEALIRRIHPVHGLLAPERGWSIASDHSGRRALDRWVLREASAQARAWNAAGIPIRVDINLAAYDLGEIDMLLCDDDLGHDARGLRIEISTSQLGGETGDRLVRFTEHCAQSGIGFVLDGFDGSLGGIAALSHLPIDALKLERQLVEGVLVSRTTRAIVEASVLVARSLGWHVIAKGAETAAQRDALVELDCDAIQGFCVAPPMTAGDFAAWLDRNGSLGRSA